MKKPARGSASAADQRPVKIRKATVADAPALAALNQSVQDMHADAFPEKFRRNVPAESVARAFGAAIQGPSAYWLIGEEEQPIAFLCAEFREHEESWSVVAHRICYLAGIAVAPEYRRKGIARALLDELKREAEARGVTSIELDVWAFNEPAKRAFAILGFRGMRERMALAIENKSKQAPAPRRRQSRANSGNG
jgi:ribosomal protein S18 acetylase RimI-like enzyme